LEFQDGGYSRFFYSVSPKWLLDQNQLNHSNSSSENDFPASKIFQNLRVSDDTRLGRHSGSGGN